MPNNSYLYKKIQALIVKEDKANKFINKKMKEKILNKMKIVNNKINNKRLQTQETKQVVKMNNNNLLNSSFSGTYSHKDSKMFEENNNKINNNIKVQNINNYIIDVHKYKINLIGNNKNINLIEFQKKLNNLNRYNKYIYISSSNKKNSISIQEKTSKKKSKIRHLSDMDIQSNNPLNQNFKSEITNKKKREEKTIKDRIKINYKKIIKSKSDNKDKEKNNNHTKKIKEIINVQNRNQNLGLGGVNKTFFTNSLINDNISNNIDIQTKTEINDYSIKTKNIKNLKYISIIKNPNKSSIYNKKEIIYPKKFINLNKRKNNSVENEHHKKKFNLDLSNLGNASNHNNYSLITLFTNQIKNDKNLEKLNKKIRNNISNNSHSITNRKENRVNSAKVKRFLSQEKAKKYYKINPNSNTEIIKDAIKTNKNSQKNNELKKENKEQIYNNMNNSPSVICCKSSINKIKSAIRNIFSNKLYSVTNNNNNLIINTFNSNSNVILRCKLVNKICNLYFELHISFCKDSQKYVLIKPNLLSGNKSFFMKFFEKFKNELQN